jgi:hypothetical protein
MELVKILIISLGMFILYISGGLNRCDKCKIRVYSKYGLIQLVLNIIAVLIIAETLKN